MPFILAEGHQVNGFLFVCLSVVVFCLFVFVFVFGGFFLRGGGGEGVACLGFFKHIFSSELDV